MFFNILNYFSNFINKIIYIYINSLSDWFNFINFDQKISLFLDIKFIKLFIYFFLFILIILLSFFMFGLDPVDYTKKMPWRKLSKNLLYFYKKK